MGSASDSDWKAKLERSFLVYDKTLKTMTTTLQELTQQLTELRMASATASPPVSTPPVIQVNTEPLISPPDRYSGDADSLFHTMPSAIQSQTPIFPYREG